MRREGRRGPVLEVKALEVAYGDIKILWGIDLEIKEGEIVSIVGSNGAGKSTLIRTISGLHKPLHGEIVYDGSNITHLLPGEIVVRGISQVPEGRKLFAGMTVYENLMMGAYSLKDKKMIKEDLDFVLHLFPRLFERGTQLAGTLSGGEQQMCAIGRALMSHPKLLLVDELSLGLSPLLVDSLIDAIEQIHQRGASILLVEQDVQIALEHAARGYVLETGRITLSGNAKEVLDSPQVKKAYLGI
jgi:branched-chain amino acid transport system ATP-binding protein